MFKFAEQPMAEPGFLSGTGASNVILMRIGTLRVLTITLYCCFDHFTGFRIEQGGDTQIGLSVIRMPIAIAFRALKHHVLDDIHGYP